MNSASKFPSPSAAVGAERNLTRFIAILLLWLPCLLSAGEVMAQDVSYVQDFINQTREIIRRAEDTVRESDSERAQRALADAWRLHEQSQALLNATPSRPMLALGASRRAREAAQDAARLALSSRGFEERARLRIERTREFRDTVAERAGELHNEPALRFVEEADRLLQRARDQFGQRNFEIAFNLLESAEMMLGRASRLLLEGGGIDRLERELEMTAELVARALDRTAESDERAARDLAERARAQLEHARGAMAGGAPLQAMRAAGRARDLAGQALARLDEQTDPASVRRLIERWDERRAELAPRIAAADRSRALVALDRAVHHRDEAAHQLAAGRLVEALRQIKVAHDELSRAEELSR